MYSVCIISRLHPRKAAGNDGIAALALKMAAPVIAEQISGLANVSFSSAKFPACWKKAVVVPVPKSGEPTEPSNNRPISLLPLISKIVERLCYDQLYPYLEQFLSKAQSGFRKNRSTETALIKLVDGLLDRLDRGEVSVMVLCDLAKAFDSLEPEILLAKLARYGVSAEGVSWFRSYLTGRTMVTRLSSTQKCVTSPPAPVKFGVPQGSILGPLLFLVFVNDMPNCGLTSQVALYADDTMLCHAGQPPMLGTILKTLQDDADILVEWMDSNRLSVNPQKTQILPISRSTVGGVELVIRGERISASTQAKYLGLILDHRLTFRPHIDATAKKCRQALGQIAWSSKSLPKIVVQKAVESLVIPRITHQSNVWGGCGKGNIATLQKVQNQAARVVCNLGYYSRAHISPYIQNLGWVRVNEEIKRRDVMMMKRIIQGKAAPDTLPLSLPSHRYSLRKQSGRGFVLPDGSQRKFGYRAVQAYNRLAPEIRSLPNGESFKKAAKSLYLTC